MKAITLIKQIALEDTLGEGVKASPFPPDEIYQRLVTLELKDFDENWNKALGELGITPKDELPFVTRMSLIHTYIRYLTVVDKVVAHLKMESEE